MQNLFFAAVRLALLAAVSLVPAMAQIYTTTGDGATVNANIYASKDAVYLSGGPKSSNCTQNGLAPGTYYFQVTDPNGVTLLSSDIIQSRSVVVAPGSNVITSTSGPHFVSSSLGPCGSRLVQLIPYANTGNPGQEYKLSLYGPNCVISGAALTADPPARLGDVATGCTPKTDNFKAPPSPIADPPADPPPLVQITGKKFYDLNMNGVQDQDGSEPVIVGWRIEKTPPAAPVDITYTSGNGFYGFLVPFDNDSVTYTIREVFPGTGNWLPTTPISGPVTVNSISPVAGPNFGNVCICAGGGLTLGFWSNKNGQALIDGTDLAMLSGLNLRDANGANFDPATYASFRTWILKATATNMAYMLSAQLAAMELNVLNGKVVGTAYIHAPGTLNANSAGFATVNVVMAEANAELGLHGTAVSGDAWRSYQEALKNALDRANNNLSFLKSGPEHCPFTTPY